MTFQVTKLHPNIEKRNVACFMIQMVNSCIFAAIEYAIDVMTQELRQQIVANFHESIAKHGNMAHFFGVFRIISVRKFYDAEQSNANHKIWGKKHKLFNLKATHRQMLFLTPCQPKMCHTHSMLLCCRANLSVAVYVCVYLKEREGERASLLSSFHSL